MKKYIFLLFISLLALPALAEGNEPKVTTGIEVLKADGFRLLRGKRVGLVTNPTGVDNNLVSDIDLLNDAPGVELVALFGPEHGVRGSAHAGDAVEGGKDQATGVPVYSLFGKQRMATDEMLRGIDVLVYDIQDIGCRSFTYISTMANIMKAAAKNNIKVVILDRPNPLGGEKVEGCLVENDCLSFVSQLKIPYIYGLTSGELATMLNEEGMLGKKCDLTVVKMKGWKRSMTYDATGLPWVMPSPHIPTPATAMLYPATGIAGELDNLSIGVGYTLPFKLFGEPWADAHQLAKAMNALQLPGVMFRPIYYTPFYAYGKSQEMQGVEIYITDYDKAELTDIQFYFLQELYRLYPDHDILGTTSSDRKNMIDKVCGSRQIRQLFMKRHSWEDARQYWHKDAEAFKALSKKYYLYNKQPVIVINGKKRR